MTLPVQYIVVPTEKYVFLTSCCDGCVAGAYKLREPPCATVVCAPVPASEANVCCKVAVQAFPRRRRKQAHMIRASIAIDSGIGNAEVKAFVGVWEKLPNEPGEVGGVFVPKPPTDADVV